MSLDDFRGAGWAFHQLMKQAQADIENGDAKPARVLARRPNPAKTYIGRFKAKLLRRAAGDWRRL